MSKPIPQSVLQEEGRLHDAINAVPKGSIQIQRRVYLEDDSTPAENFFSSNNMAPKPSKDYMILSGNATQHSFAIGIVAQYRGFRLAFAPEITVNGRQEKRVYFVNRQWLGIESPPLEYGKGFHEMLTDLWELFQGTLRNFLLSIIDFSYSGGSLSEQPVPAHHRGRIFVHTHVEGVAHEGGTASNFSKATYFNFNVVDDVITYPYMKYLIGKQIWEGLPPNSSGAYRQMNNVRSFADYRRYASGIDWNHPLYKPWGDFCREWGHDPFTPPQDPRRVRR